MREEEVKILVKDTIGDPYVQLMADVTFFMEYRSDVSNTSQLQMDTSVINTSFEGQDIKTSYGVAALCSLLENLPTDRIHATSSASDVFSVLDVLLERGLNLDGLTTITSRESLLQGQVTHAAYIFFQAWQTKESLAQDILHKIAQKCGRKGVAL